MTEQLSPLTATRADFNDPSEAVFTFHMMRASRQRFDSSLSDLSTRQLTEVTHKAEETVELENQALASPEALGVVILPIHVASALDEFVAGYPDSETFTGDLEINGLTIDSVALGVYREMVFAAIMQRVAARHSPLDPLDAQDYYEQHREDFTTPERRTARHLLMTVNSDIPQSRNAALERLDWLAGQMTGPSQWRAKRFASLALQHSAGAGGRLGELTRGQLDPRLDDVLFRLQEGAVSEPVETELGFHLIYCERIQPARVQPFSEARESIRALLIERRRCECQASWIAKLRKPGH